MYGGDDVFFALVYRVSWSLLVGVWRLVELELLLLFLDSWYCTIELAWYVEVPAERRGDNDSVVGMLMRLIRSTQYIIMSEPSKDELHDHFASLDDDRQEPPTAQPGSGENAGEEPRSAQATTSTNKDLEINPSKTSSTVSLEQRSIHDAEKGLPADPLAEKEPAVTDAEHDPNIVDWDGDADPENPLNWSARKKWYANFID